MPRLTGRVAIVTGASRGIGLAIARRLLAEGAKVCVTARKPEALNEAVRSLGAGAPAAAGVTAIGVAGRSDDPDHRAETVRRAAEALGPVDIVVNNAGINPVYGPLSELDLTAARKILDVNLLSALGWAQAACADGLTGRGGSIINISSVSGLLPAPGIAFYGVSKAALNQLTTSLAVELSPTVRVNAIAPAVVKTRFAAALYEGREEEVAARYPLRRLGLPDDVAGVAAFLASDDAGWLTGQVITLDGGLTLVGHG